MFSSPFLLPDRFFPTSTMLFFLPSPSSNFTSFPMIFLMTVIRNGIFLSYPTLLCVFNNAVHVSVPLMHYNLPVAISRVSHKLVTSIILNNKKILTIKWFAIIFIPYLSNYLKYSYLSVLGNCKYSPSFKQKLVNTS